jgi:hypothetical protein
MLTALILVCSLATGADLGACTKDNAVEVLQVPETFFSPVTCFMHGQAYLAETSIGRDLGENEAVKVLCVRSRTAFGTAPPLPPVSSQLGPGEMAGR